MEKNYSFSLIFKDVFGEALCLFLIFIFGLCD